MFYVYLGMETFKQLLDESYNGNFIFEMDGKLKKSNIEIDVNYSSMEIVVRYYIGNRLDCYKKDTYYSLSGMFGFDSVEQKFNKIINELL